MKLWLDDMRSLPVDEGWVHARSVNEAIAFMETLDITYASLDHDLGDFSSDGGDGIAFALWMAEHNKWPSDGIAVHSMNPVGVTNMLAIIEHYSTLTGKRVNPSVYLRSAKDSL